MNKVMFVNNWEETDNEDEVQIWLSLIGYH